MCVLCDDVENVVFGHMSIKEKASFAMKIEGENNHCEAPARDRHDGPFDRHKDAI